MNYAFYDFETTGRSGTWDQIIQVGAVLVNAEFQELDRFEAKCSLRPGLVPEPGALLVNKTTPDMLRKTNLSHYGLVNQMLQTFKKWTPSIFIGYNSIGFDEEFLRKTLFKTLNDPYLTQFDGNKRGDILGLIRTAHLYYPDCIKTPTSDKGNAVFKLDQLAPLNGIEHGNAHDAIGDVIATIGIAKIIANKAPAVWKSSLMTTSKSEVNTIVQNEKLFCFNEYFYGKARPYVVTFLCFHPKYNWPQCFDLKEDPSTYLNMSVQDLKEAMKKSPKIIRSVKNNKHPVIMNPKFGENFDGYKQFLGRIHEVYVEAMSEYFNESKKRYTSFYLKKELCKDLICEGAQIFLKEGIDDDFKAHPEYLKNFVSYETAYYQLNYEIAKKVVKGIELILDENTKLTDVFISGGFINNEVFIKYLSLMQKNVRIKLSNTQNESAYGAALLMKDYL